MAARRTRSTRSAPAAGPRIGLALAGGGPLGAIWEIGALCALEESLRGLRLDRLHGYIGVSAGSFIAAGLANGLTPRQLCRAFIENDTGPEGPGFTIDPSLFVRPAVGEITRRLVRLPGLLAEAAWRHAFQRRSLLSAFERVGQALPAGVFSGAPLEAHLRHVFSTGGRHNDFRRLKRRLVIVATDLDRGEAVPFGLPGWDHVPISRAIQASAALPGLFPPVEIGGRHHVDGALKKTLHARVLLDQGCRLVLCLNPLVPYDATDAPRRRVLEGGDERIPRLVDGGLPVVLSQTFRSLIHSRLELGLQGYARSHPEADVLLFEPDQHDPEMFLANTFSYAQRRLLAEHAYQRTRDDLRARKRQLAPALARHGITLDEAALDEPRHLLAPRPAALDRRPSTARALRRLERTLDDLEHALPRPPQPA